MARGQKRSPEPRYKFPGVDPEDRTLGGAIPPELFDRLQGDQPQSPDPEQPPEAD